MRYCDRCGSKLGELEITSILRLFLILKTYSRILIIGYKPRDSV